MCYTLSASDRGGYNEARSPQVSASDEATRVSWERPSSCESGLMANKGVGEVTREPAAVGPPYRAATRGTCSLAGQGSIRCGTVSNRHP